jgi:1,4-alpha-glucan branching enzyme
MDSLFAIDVEIFSNAGRTVDSSRKTSGFTPLQQNSSLRRQGRNGRWHELCSNHFIYRQTTMTSITTDGKVQFRFFRPNVNFVQVVGDFAGWEGNGLTMQSGGDGWWSAEVSAPPGDYRFRYLADGTWFPDYAAFGIEAHGAGFNSIVRIPEKRSFLETETDNAKQVAKAVC